MNKRTKGCDKKLQFLYLYNLHVFSFLAFNKAKKISIIFVIYLYSVFYILTL